MARGERWPRGGCAGAGDLCSAAAEPAQLADAASCRVSNSASAARRGASAECAAARAAGVSVSACPEYADGRSRQA
ncbi:hypothetical protein [Paenibacillus sp. DCT19]|uniref:hypothetical protein n=1 Tax=Paenibacillus sp. DCT19 TaxID=2211212 RepID=UPI0020C377D0|nr:hypothetical protein [Paenibacillus sp. DCT19]